MWNNCKDIVKISNLQNSCKDIVTTMGHTKSKERQLFIDFLLHMLNKWAVKVTHFQIAGFLHLVQEQCPWFLEEGAVNLKTWTEVEKQLKLYYTHHSPEEVPVDASASWYIIRDVLYPQQEIDKMPLKAKREPGENTSLLTPAPFKLRVISLSLCVSQWFLMGTQTKCSLTNGCYSFFSSFAYVIWASAQTDKT